MYIIHQYFSLVAGIKGEETLLVSVSQSPETYISSHLERKTTVTTKQRSLPAWQVLSQQSRGKRAQRWGRGANTTSQNSCFTGPKMSWVPEHQAWSPQLGCGAESGISLCLNLMGCDRLVHWEQRVWAGSGNAISGARGV